MAKYECCFCCQSVEDDDSETLFLLVASSAAVKAKDLDVPQQQLRCHAKCLGDRLAKGVPFDPLMFND